MGRRGPKPEPAGIRSQKEPVRSKRNKPGGAGETAEFRAAGEAPKWLTGEGRKIWDRLAPQLRQAKLLTDADTLAFARYCKHYERWLDLQRRMKAAGDIYEIETASGKVLRAHPAFTMADRLDRMMLAFEDRFGMNPAERQKIMAARANTGAMDLFNPQPKDERRAEDPAAEATPAAEPIEGPIGLLN